MRNVTRRAKPELTGDVHQTWPGKRWWQKPGPWCRLRHRIVGSSRIMNPVSRTITLTLGFYGLWIGGAILDGGPARWSGPSYAMVNQLPGAPYTWGAAMLVFGLLILASLALHTFTPKTFGLFGMSAWCCAFSIAGRSAQTLNSAAGNTGPPTYMALAVVVALMIFVYERPPTCAPSAT